MFDTNLVIVGNVLTRPEWRRVADTDALVAHFRVASTSRRFDRENNRWMDGRNLRVRVTAWRRLAEGVASSVMLGDPVIVYGRLYSRDWKDGQDNRRISYEMEAYSIGHDLARGRSRFYRGRAAGPGSDIEDAGGDAYVGGALTVPVTGEEAPVIFGQGMPMRFADEDEPQFLEVVASSSSSSETDETDEPDEQENDGDEALAVEVERLVAESGSAREPVAA